MNRMNRMYRWSRWNRWIFDAAAAAARAAGERSYGAAAPGGAWGPGVIRALAILQVFLQGCADRLTNKTGSEGQEQTDTKSTPPASATAEAPPPRPEPAIVDATAFPEALRRDLEGYYARLEPRGAWRRLTGRLAAERQGAPEWSAMIAGVEALGREEPGGEAFAGRLAAHFDRRGRGEAETIAELDALLAAAEAWPLYDEFFAGYVWLRAMQARDAEADAGAQAALLARIERHLRVAHALLRASAETGRVEFSAWRSKAAPPRGWSDVRVPAGLGDAALRLYPETDAGAWASEGTLALVVAGERPVTLRRAGQAIAIAPGGALTLRRLDLLEVGAGGDAQVRHPTLGVIRLPAGAAVSAWGLASRLDAAAEATLRRLVDGAIGGDEAAIEALQAVLPAAHRLIRAALADPALADAARGRLEMVLMIFEV